MNTIKFLYSSKLKVFVSFLIAFILSFLLYETINLEQKIEKNMLEISTSDVFSITKNNALEIKRLLGVSDDYVKDIQANVNLQKRIEQKLKLLITSNIKYAYLLYKDKNETFRFLVDASNPDEKALMNQKFDVDSQEWFDIYVDKKERFIQHEFLKSLSISFLVPIIKEDTVELVLAIDFSLKKVENINSVIQLMQNAIVVILAILFLFFTVLIIQSFNYHQVKKTAYIDKLTNVYNRNYLQEKEGSIQLENYILGVIDIDYFKKVNDTYGHNIGDLVLKKTAGVILNTIRSVNEEDIVIRYGGEEFIVLVKKSAKQKMKSRYRVFNRILKNIEQYKFKISETEDLSITVSIGVTLNPNKYTNFSEAFKVADSALYKVKENGRNNIEIVE